LHKQTYWFIWNKISTTTILPTLPEVGRNSRCYSVYQMDDPEDILYCWALIPLRVNNDDWQLNLSSLTTNLYYFVITIHQIFYLACDWSECVTWLNIPQLKLENIWVMLPNFKRSYMRQKNCKDKHNSLHLTLKKWWSLDITFTLLQAHSVLKLLPQEDVHFSEQIMPGVKYPDIFSHQM